MSANQVRDIVCGAGATRSLRKLLMQLDPAELNKRSSKNNQSERHPRELKQIEMDWNRLREGLAKRDRQRERPRGKSHELFGKPVKRFICEVRMFFELF